MNENINLCEILKDCPRGFKLYSAVHGEVTFLSIDDGEYPIGVLLKNNNFTAYYSSRGKVYTSYGECILFPSKVQRDWSKFTAPWYKREKFNPKTLQPFDKVLVRDECCKKWRCDFYSHYDNIISYPYVTINSNYDYCIPYNDETKHLVGTTDEAPDFYKYWED